MEVHKLGEPKRLLSFTNEEMVIDKEISFNMTLQTEEGELLLRKVKAWLSKTALPKGLGDILISREIMKTLGYDPQALLTKARQVSAEYEVGGVYLDPTDEEKSFEAMEHLRCLPEMEMTREDEQKKVLDLLENKIGETERKGASKSFITKTWVLLKKHVNVFRMVLGRDPPVKIEPMEVRLKEGAVPIKCKARRYPQEHRDFMAKHMKELEEAGLVFRNNKSRWTSPPLIVKKSGLAKFRMTVNVRAVNAQTETLQWPMPMLEVVVDHLQGAKCFFSLDFFKGYWQLPLHPNSQEHYSILTDMGIFTPTRVLMGGSDSVAFCQAAVQEIFADDLYKGLLAWLDDVLGYESDEDSLYRLLKRTLEICTERGLKLNPDECVFFTKTIKWCGRIFSENGVEQDPERITALTEMPEPTTAQELQQFTCAVNWMRMAIPGYNLIMEPLLRIMEKTYIAAGGRTKTKVARVKLEEVGWGKNGEQKSIQRVKEALAQAVRLAHVDPDKTVCIFTDASEQHWGAAVTQVPRNQLHRGVEMQEHEPLMFLSGSFSGAAERWAIIEKEAFALVESVKRADYLLHRPGGFQLFTDHRNLRYIFSPESVVSAVPKYTADKLQRWSMILMGYEYQINHISGEDNVWADLLSRWGTSLTTICAIKLARMPESPQLTKFKWPNKEEIKRLQVSAALEGRKNVHGLMIIDEDKILVPMDATDLKLRLCIIAHNGAAGHQGLSNTCAAVAEYFWWPRMKEDIKMFVQGCLHCSSTRGGKIIPRPRGEQMHATKPNEIYHFDFLYLESSNTGMKYLLVIKDDASKYVWLRPCRTADALTVYEVLLDWFAAFGVAYTWISDQGSHFKNQIISHLQHALGTHHHFTTAHCPWANGTAEVVNRSVLRIFRALLSEWRMKPDQWVICAPIVQLVLNNTKLASLSGEAPITCMTSLAAMSALAPIAVNAEIEGEVTTMEAIHSLKHAEMKQLFSSIEQLHKKAGKAAAKRRGKQVISNSFPNFDVGDFVLQATVEETKTRKKLQVVWKGPSKILRVLSPWVYEVEDMITKCVKEVHASRLKFYHDSHLEVTEELLKQVAHSQEGFEVENFGLVRYNEPEKKYEIEVKWRGLEGKENSLEPVSNLMEDVPVLLKKHLRARRQDATFQKLVQDMEWASLLGG